MPERPASTVATWATNPNTVAQALAYAHRQDVGNSSVWYLRCLAFCGKCYGLPYTGTHYAIDLWHKMPSNMKHRNDRIGIPDGALLFYATGSRAGHVALYAGNNQVYSTDICHNGRVCLTPFNNLINGKWRLNYLGWTPPYFLDNPASHIGGQIPDPLGAALTPVGGTATFFNPFSLPIRTVKGLISAVDFFHKVETWASNPRNWLWILLIIVGIILIGVAIFRFTSNSITDNLGSIVKAVTK